MTRTTMTRSRNNRPVPEQKVRERAYQIYQARCKEDVPGDPVADWLRAEQELRSRAA